MSDRSIEQLKEIEAGPVERLKAVRAEIRARENVAMKKLGKSYAKTIAAAVNASGGAVNA